MIINLLSKIKRKLILISFLTIFCTNHFFAQDGFYINTSLQFTQGKSLDNSKNSFIGLFTGLRYQSENVGISISIPILADNINGGISGSAMMGPNGTSNMNSGSGHMNFRLGDLYSYLDYKIYSDFYNNFDVYINGQLKVPTASSSMNYGSGEFDYGATLSARKMFGSFLGIVEAGYLNLGDPEGVNYINPFIYGLGIGKLFNQGKYSLLLYYYGYSKIAEDYDAPDQVSLGTNYRANDDLIFSVIVSAGIGNLTPEYILSGGIRIKL